MVSPASAGLSVVTGNPATLAQHKFVLVAVSTTEPVAVVVVVVVVVEVAVGDDAVDVAVKAMLSPSGPGTFAIRRIVVYAGAALAVTNSSALALIKEISASRTVASVSALST